MTAAARKMLTQAQPAPQRTGGPTEASPPPRRMSTRELFAEGLQRVDVKALAEADEKYGTDFERELADLAGGRHPSQRS